MAKDHRFGGKQQRGSSRASYFTTRKMWRAAANKQARIDKDAKRRKSC